MDLFDVAKSCARRWYVFLVLLGITLAVSYNAYAKVQPVYYASTTLGLAPPSVTAQAGGNEVRTNGLVNTGGIMLLTNLLAMGMSNGPVHAAVAAQGGLPDFTATVFQVPGGQLPLVVIEATHADSELVTRTLELAAVQGDGVLRDIQVNAGVPDDQMLRTYPVGSPSVPAAAIPSRTRTTVSIFVAGLGLTIIATTVVDLVLSRRRKRPTRAADLQVDEPVLTDSTGPGIPEPVAGPARR